MNGLGWNPAPPVAVWYPVPHLALPHAITSTVASRSDLSARSSCSTRASSESGDEDDDAVGGVITILQRHEKMLNALSLRQSATQARFKLLALRQETIEATQSQIALEKPHLKTQAKPVFTDCDCARKQTRTSVLDFNADEIMNYNGNFLALDCSPSLIGKVASRRVIIQHLPPDTNLVQVLRGVRSYGGIITASLLETARITGSDTKSALVEFVYPDSAREFVDYIQNTTPLVYEDVEGLTYTATASVIPSESFHYAARDRQYLEADQTRAIFLPKFPAGTVWYFIAAVGIRNIVQVKYNDYAEDLAIEFTTLFHADMAMRLIQQGNFTTYCPDDKSKLKYEHDSSQGNVSTLVCDRSIIIPHVKPSFLVTQWDRPPFNSFWPKKLQPVIQPESLDLRPPQRSRRSQHELIAEALEIEVDEVDDFLADRRDFEDTEYRILGSNIKLTRRKWGWSMLTADDLKLRMADTLHDPEWRTEWDTYFETTNQINIRTWERYGTLAEHRRERAVELGCEA